VVVSKSRFGWRLDMSKTFHRHGGGLYELSDYSDAARAINQLTLDWMSDEAAYRAQ
jgi:hypothetical protein